MDNLWIIVVITNIKQEIIHDYNNYRIIKRVIFCPGWTYPGHKCITDTHQVTHSKELEGRPVQMFIAIINAFRCGIKEDCVSRIDDA